MSRNFWANCWTGCATFWAPTRPQSCWSRRPRTNWWLGAACGIEEEVYQGVRVPLRTGFAGRIAAEQRPVLLDRVDDTTVANPILWEKGIRAMLGVPLLSGGKTIGVLHVGTLQERSFSDADVQLLQLVAERVALATQTRLLEIERAASRVLERSLLPPRLPVCAGLDSRSATCPPSAV